MSNFEPTCCYSVPGLNADHSGHNNLADLASVATSCVLQIIVTALLHEKVTGISSETSRSKSAAKAPTLYCGFTAQELGFEVDIEDESAAQAVPLQEIPKKRKKALLIGINYIGQRGELKGCINDVHNIKDLLMSRFGH